MGSVKWTDDELKILNNNFDMHHTELAKLINRTPKAIHFKKESILFEPKMVKCPRCKKEYLKENINTKGCPDCVRKMRQEYRIRKQVEERNKSYEEEQKYIGKLQKKSYVCKGCGEKKPGTEFQYLKHVKRLNNKCKACASAVSKELRKKRISEGRDW